jgi:phosphocarrier protein
VAVKYKSSVVFRYGDNEANAKSVLSVLGAGIKSGTQLEFICKGEDEEEALAAIIAAVEDGLGE